MAEPTEPRVEPPMLILARESRGLSRTALARATGIAPAVLKRYEAGTQPVSSAHLATLVEVLAYPPSFFALTARTWAFSSGCPQYRLRRPRPKAHPRS